MGHMSLPPLSPGFWKIQPCVRIWATPAGPCWSNGLRGKKHGAGWNCELAVQYRAFGILGPLMRFAVDAHAIGRHLTGNEVYIRSLLGAFATQEPDCEFLAYISADAAARALPACIRTRRVAANPFW